MSLLPGPMPAVHGTASPHKAHRHPDPVCRSMAAIPTAASSESAGRRLYQDALDKARTHELRRLREQQVQALILIMCRYRDSLQTLHAVPDEGL